MIGVGCNTLKLLENIISSLYSLITLIPKSFHTPSNCSGLPVKWGQSASWVSEYSVNLSALSNSGSIVIVTNLTASPSSFDAICNFEVSKGQTSGQLVKMKLTTVILPLKEEREKLLLSRSIREKSPAFPLASGVPLYSSPLISSDGESSRQPAIEVTSNTRVIESAFLFTLFTLNLCGPRR